MISIELEGDDLIKDGELVRLGRVARAIAKGLGVSNSLNSERKIFPRINAAVQSGALNPIDPETLERLSKSDYGIGLVHFDELAEWGRSTKQFDFRICAPASQKVDAGETAATDTALPWAGEATSALPVTAKRIAAAFPVTWADKWPERLKKAAGGKSYQWLTGTVVHRGSRKPGDANTYNPAAVAAALVLHGDMTRAACDAAIKRCFSGWIDEWNSKAEYLKI